jgi:hypothetical protein
LEHGAPFEQVLELLDLAITTVECLHGESRVRLDARFADDPAKRSLVIDASTEVGRSLNQVFVGYLGRELGESAFKVERVDRAPEAAAPAGAPR